MNLLLRQFGRLRLTALILTLLPFMLLPLLGVLWLWQHGDILLWLGFLLAAGAAGFALHRLANLREKASLEQFNTQPDPHWPPSSADPWETVEALAEQAQPAEWPLSEGGKLLELGKLTLSQVAHHYHPKRKEPLLELTVPHTLLIIEKASRELREQITAHIPLSHQFTLGDMARAKRWKEVAGQFENVYRLGYAVVDPSSIIFREFRREMSSRIMGYGSDKVQHWLLQEYIRKVGYYAIALYSGQTLLEDHGEQPPLSKASARNLKESQDKALEPLRFLVLGRTNAGKSSLINALFGEVTSAADVLPDTTTDIQAYRLPPRDDQPEPALIFDTPGLDGKLLSSRALKQAVLQADLIFFVSPAHLADRDGERAQLEQIRQWQQQANQQQPAPILLVVTHIDKLRPVRQWQPPYDLQQDDNPKAASIQAASQAAAEQLEVALDKVVPVCLAEGRLYNVDDALWAAILHHQEESKKVRLLRCLEQRRRQQNWSLLWQQLSNSGRLLVKKAVSR